MNNNNTDLLSVLERRLHFFGVHNLPWIIRTYLVLFVVLVVGLIVAAIINNPSGTKLVDIFADLLKVIGGALIGSLTMASNRMWNRTNADGDLTKQPDTADS